MSPFCCEQGFAWRHRFCVLRRKCSNYYAENLPVVKRTAMKRQQLQSRANITRKASVIILLFTNFQQYGSFSPNQFFKPVPRNNCTNNDFFWSKRGGGSGGGDHSKINGRLSLVQFQVSEPGLAGTARSGRYNFLMCVTALIVLCYSEVETCARCEDVLVCLPGVHLV